MKRFFILLGVVLIAVASCRKAEENLIEPQQPEGSPYVIKTDLSGVRTTNDRTHTKWSVNDAINVFHALAGTTDYVNDGQFIIDEKGLEQGIFTGYLKEGLDKSKTYDWYVFYPYSSLIETPANVDKGAVIVGSEFDKAQTQTGNDSMAHLAGTNLPAFGRALGVAATDELAITVDQVCAVAEVIVANTTNDVITVNSVSLTGTEDIVGSYYVNFAGEAPVFTKAGTDCVSKTACLDVNDATTIAKGEKASFFVAFKPFTATSNSVIKLTVNGYEKSINLVNGKAFAPGVIHRINFNYDRSTSILEFSTTQPDITVDMVKGSLVKFVGVNGFHIDVDFFDKQADEYIFRGVTGKYKMVADYTHSFIRVDPVNADGSYITATDPIKAIYAIGVKISKGGLPYAGWNIDTGAWPLAQYEKDKYSISFLAGRDVTNGTYFHLYNHRGWTSTFKHTAFSSVELGPAFTMDTSEGGSGHIGTTAAIRTGKGYRLLFDFTEGYDKGKVSVEDVSFPLVGDDVSVCGIIASKLGENHYCVNTLSISKGDAFTVEGRGTSGIWIDPDYVTDGKFSAMSGYYQVDVYTDKSYVEFHRLKSDGGTFADINTGAIWLMGWGVGNPSLNGSSGTNQPGWDPSKAVPMAEIATGVYQFSGIAAEETDMKVGHRIRYDYLGLVWYGEKGWNQGNKGTMKGTTNEIRYTDRAKEYLADVPGNGWQVLSKNLEKGEFYVLTIDLNTPNVELVDFYKK